MKRIAVIGTNEFRMGFEIAGIKNSFNDDEIENTINGLMNNPEIGIIILKDESIKDINEELKEKVLQSISPVFVVISENDSNEELRALIKKSIGVDVWDK